MHRLFRLLPICALAALVYVWFPQASPAQALIYVPDGRQIAIVSAESNKPLDYIDLEETIAARSPTLSPDGTRLYVISLLFREVIGIDTTSHMVVNRIPVPSDLVSTAITPDGKRLYATAALSVRDDLCRELDECAAIAAIDIATNRVESWIRVPTILISAIAITPDGSRAYVTDGWGDGRSVWVLDTLHDRIVAQVPVGRNPNHVAITPDGSRAYVFNAGDGTTSVIDTASNTVATTIPSPRLDRLAFTPDGKRGYAIASNSSVAVIDVPSNNLVATVMVNAPETIAITPDGSRAFVHHNELYMAEIDTGSNRVVRDLFEGGLEGRTMAMSPTPLDLYVVNDKTSTVSVVGASSDEVAGSIGHPTSDSFWPCRPLPIISRIVVPVTGDEQLTKIKRLNKSGRNSDMRGKTVPA